MIVVRGAAANSANSSSRAAVEAGDGKAALGDDAAVVVVVDNPDQRLSDDVDLITRLSMDLALATLRKAMNIASFGAILYRSVGQAGRQAGRQAHA